MRKVVVCLLAVLVCSWAVANAGQVAKGDKELAFSFSYVDFSFDDGGGDLKDMSLAARFGYLLTDTHEVGGVFSYLKHEETGSPDEDGTGFGAFYNYNFKAGTNMNPYLEAHYQVIGGDAGDVVDSQYGLAVGIKMYPWDNGGFRFGVSWDQLTGADSNPDGDGIVAFAGIQLKWN